MSYQQKIIELGDLVELLIAKTKPFIDLGNKELAEKYVHNYFYPEDPLPVPERETTPEGKYWLGNFAYYTEIIASFERLFQAHAFICRFPRLKYYNFHRINEMTWMRYHFESYLQENYLLAERTDKWISSLITRARRKSLSNEEVTLLKIRKAIIKSFKGINIVRGSHVHSWRYDPKDFQRVDSLNFLISKGRLRSLKILRNIRLHFVLEDRKRTIWKNNHELISLYDVSLGRTKKILLQLE